MLPPKSLTVFKSGTCENKWKIVMKKKHDFVKIGQADHVVVFYFFFCSFVKFYWEVFFFEVIENLSFGKTHLMPIFCRDEKL